MRTQYFEGIHFDWLNGWKDLRNGGPLEMLAIAEPTKKIKVLLHQFSNLKVNLHYICLSR